MKILQVVPYFPPDHTFGGPVKMAYQVSRESVKRKHEVVVFTSDAKDLESRPNVESRALPAYNIEVMRNIVPIKMYEYMACGKPVISTRLPGIVKEFDHNNGVICVDQPMRAHWKYETRDISEI